MAGRIPRVFINDLLARTDIVDLIDARVKLKKQGKNFHACCPFHNEKTPSFTVNGEKQFYHCFGCGAHVSGAISSTTTGQDLRQKCQRQRANRVAAADMATPF